jgi:hypothetical protein
MVTSSRSLQRGAKATRETATTLIEILGFACLVSAAFVGLGLAPGLAALGASLLLVGYLAGR